MKSGDLIDVLADWNFWQREPDTGIERSAYLERLGRLAKTGQAITITGARRAGKSTLMRQYAKKLLEGGAKRNNLLFVNFEDPRFSGRLSLGLMQDIYESYRQDLKPSGRPYLFLDEVQHVAGWEKFVNALHERKEAHVVVSGSSSKLLGAEFGTALTGRHVSLEVFPLGFREFLGFRGVEIGGRADLAGKRIAVRGLMKEFLEYGGFPAVVLSGEKKDMLLRHFEDVISRDVVARHRLRSADKVMALARFYVTNTASTITFNSIKNFLGMPVDTVERFSSYLAEAFLFFFVKKFSYSLKEQEKNPRKVYCIDTGLRNAVSFRFSEDMGKLLENAVFIELKRRGHEVYYWAGAGGREVDFLVLEGQKVSMLMQACWDVDNPRVRERERSALLAAMEEYGLKEGLIITSEYEDTEKAGDKVLRFVPVWKWSLEQNVPASHNTGPLPQ